MVVDDLLPAEVRRMAALVPGGARRRPRRWPRWPSAFAVYRSYLPDGVERSRPRPRDCAEPAGPSWSDTLARAGARLHDPADELARRMQQLSGATMAKGVEDTAFYRYARFVALNEVGGDPAQFGIPVRGLPRAAGPAAGRPARVDDRPVHPRHQARRGRPGAAGGARRDRRASGRASPSEFLGGRGGPEPAVRLLPGPDPGRHRADRAGPDARVRREGDARGQRRHHLDRSRPRLRGGGARGGRPGVRRCRAASRLGRSSTPRSPRRAGRTRSARSWSSSPCPGSRTSTRAPSCGRTRSSTRTTADRSTSTCAAGAAGPSLDGTAAGRRHRGGEALGDRPRAAAPARPSRSCSAATGRRGRRTGRPTTWSASTAAVRSPSPPGCRSASARHGGWRDTASTSAARWWTC